MFEQQKQKNEKKTAMDDGFVDGSRYRGNDCHHDTILQTTSRHKLQKNAEVLVVIDAGCVVETSKGHSHVVSDCDSSVGDIVSVTFHVPGAELNGYYDRIQEKLETVEP